MNRGVALCHNGHHWLSYLQAKDGTIVWRGKQQLWGREESRNKEDAPSCRLRFPGSMRIQNRGCAITGSGIMIAKVDSTCVQIP